MKALIFLLVLTSCGQIKVSGSVDVNHSLAFKICDDFQGAAKRNCILRVLRVLEGVSCKT